MRIGLVVTGLQRIDARRATSDHASTRLRALIPATGLGRRGHGLLICSDRDLFTGAVDAHLDALDVLIVHKSRLDLSVKLDLARAGGAAVVVDLCDHVFLHPILSAFYPAILARADLVTAATEAMAEVAAEHVDRPIAVIPDAVEGARGDAGPAAAGAGPRFLWFGRSQNAGALLELLPELACFSDATLQIVTDIGDGFRTRVAAAAPAGLAVTMTPWNPVAVEGALAACDLVVLPADPGPLHRVKSANRMERALWGGRMVVARASRVSEPWSDLVYLDSEPIRGIVRALEDRGAWVSRIVEAQERLSRIRSADALALQWEAAAAAVLKTLPVPR
ncbi:MAG: hypothetical protein P1U88_05300 [Thalassobaculaceae bacterium]|nr:hypothetical protein [Thalassobaculaceae bacterium]